MKLLKLELKKQDVTSIYYVADKVNLKGAVSKNPTHDYKLAIKISKTINGKKIYKRKVIPFKKTITLIRAVEKMQIVKQELKFSLENPDVSIIKEYQLDDAFNHFYKKKEAKNLSKKTLQGYRLYYEVYIQPVLGKKPLHLIETIELQNIINQMLSEGKKPRTAQHVIQIMRPLFKEFMHRRDSKITFNPAMALELPRFNNDIDIELTLEQIKKLNQEIRSYVDNKRIGSVLIWVSHGRRLNEVLSLKWEHIDIENSFYTIIAENNKARKSMSYKMTKIQYETLKDIKRHNGYIFSSFGDVNKKMNNSTIRHHWKIVLERAGIEKLRIHDLRHIIGRELVSSGYSLEQIAAVLGHSSTSITKRYSTVTRDVASEAIESFFQRVGQ